MKTPRLLALPVFTLVLATSGIPAQEKKQDEIARTLEFVRATDTEMRWQLIPWRRSLSAALAEGRKLGKPVFFFGYDGTIENCNS